MNGRVFFRDPTMFESNNTQHSFGPKRQLTFRFRVVDVVSSVVRVVLPAVYIVVLVLSFVFFGVPCGVHRLQNVSGLVSSWRRGVTQTLVFGVFEVSSMSAVVDVADDERNPHQCVCRDCCSYCCCCWCVFLVLHKSVDWRCRSDVAT